MALNCILTARNAKLTPRADIIINYIKTSLIHVVKVKPASTVTECLKSRNLIKVLNSGFTSLAFLGLAVITLITLTRN